MPQVARQSNIIVYLQNRTTETEVKEEINIDFVPDEIHVNYIASTTGNAVPIILVWSDLVNDWLGCLQQYQDARYTCIKFPWRGGSIHGNYTFRLFRNKTTLATPADMTNDLAIGLSFVQYVRYKKEGQPRM